MNNLAQASYGGTWIFLALGIAIGLVALAAWATHVIWYLKFVRSYGKELRSLGKENVTYYSVVRKSLPRLFLGTIGFMVPIVGIIHGFVIWVWRWCAGRGLHDFPDVFS
jgi:hypothetical protein